MIGVTLLHLETFRRVKSELSDWLAAVRFMVMADGIADYEILEMEFPDGRTFIPTLSGNAFARAPSFTEVTHA